MKAAILTVGCRLNQSESDALRSRLREQGIALVVDPAEADRCYINTCTVTSAADRSSVQLIRRVARLRPKPEVVVVGCLSERDPERLARIDGVDEVWSNRTKQSVIEGVCPSTSRSRVWLKVQDGCDYGCAYCVVSRLRSRPRSLPPEMVVEQFADLVAEGFGEVVLTGLNLGTYGCDRGTDLASLLDRLLALTGRFRIRLASLEPDTIGARLVERLGDNRVCPHFHLPLQSGDDRVLERMGRRYSVRRFGDTLSAIRDVRPDACVGLDVICGLPGEDDGSYECGRDRITALEPAYLHVFRFSPRPGTVAAGMPGIPEREQAAARVRQMRSLSSGLMVRYSQRFDGDVRQAIAEDSRTALTDNYLRLELRLDCPPPPRSLVSVRVRMDRGRLRGELVSGRSSAAREALGAFEVRNGQRV